MPAADRAGRYPPAVESILAFTGVAALLTVSGPVAALVGGATLSGNATLTAAQLAPARKVPPKIVRSVGPASPITAMAGAYETLKLLRGDTGLAIQVMPLVVGMLGAAFERTCLRRVHKFKAYTHEKSFDYTGNQRGLGLNPDGTPKKMRFAKAEQVVEVAVLVGDFASFDETKPT